MAVTINGTTGIVTPDIGVDGSTLVIDAANNRIGIGTSSPGTPLDVVGIIQSDTGLQVAGHPVIGYSTITGGYATRLGSTGSSTLNKTQIYARGAHVATFDGADGNVGIGTDTPTTKLQVKAGSNVTTDYPLTIANNAVNYGMQFGAYGASNKTFGATSIDYKIEIGGDLILDTTGNVGIGTDNPGDHLEILNNNASGLTFKTTQNHYAQITSDCNRTGANSHLLAIEGYWNGTPVAEIALTAGSDTTNKDDGQIIFRTSSANNLSSNERLRITNTGRLVIGHTSEVTGAYDNSAQTKQVQIVNGANDGNQGLGIYSYSSSGWAPRLELAASRSSSKGGHTVVTDGQSCGLMVFNGSDGTNFSTAAMIGSNVDGTPADNAIPGALSFYTSPGVGLVERLRVDSDGNVRVNNGTLRIFGNSSYEEQTSLHSYNSHSATGHNPSWRSFVRFVPTVSSGTYLKIPFTYQGNFYTRTYIRVRGISAQYNSASPKGFLFEGSYGHLTSINSSQTHLVDGNISSVTSHNGSSASSPPHIRLNFTSAYTGNTNKGVDIFVEWFTAIPGYSVRPEEIVLN